MVPCFLLKAQSIQFLMDQKYFPESSLNAAYCPNAQDDQIGSGGYDFNGGVAFTQESIWRIETNPENSILYLDVVFSFTGTTNPNVYVRGKRSLEIFRYEGNTNSIVGFRQTRATFTGYTPWMNKATGRSDWRGSGDGGIFCEDDNEPDFVGISGGGGINNGIFYLMDIQGDTGGSDISTDRNCSCDTRVLKIYWEQNIQIAIAPDRDRDGLQDRAYFSGLSVDNDIRSNEVTTRLLVEMHGNRMESSVHNNDCKRFNGKIKAAVVNAATNRLYPVVGNDVLIDWSNGNTRRDFNFRDTRNIESSKVYYNVPRADLDEGKVALILIGDNLKACHKGCGLCTDYRCNVSYGKSVEIPLNRFRNQSGTHSMIVNAEMKSRSPDPNHHYIKLPIKFSY